MSIWDSYRSSSHSIILQGIYNYPSIYRALGSSRNHIDQDDVTNDVIVIMTKTRGGGGGSGVRLKAYHVTAIFNIGAA